MTTAPRVEILLLNWMGWRDTIECLESLLALEYSNYRIVICDNESSDGSVEKIEAWARGELHLEPTFRGPRSGAPRSRIRSLSWLTIDRAAAEAGSVSESVDLLIIRTGGNLGFSGGNNVGLRHIMVRGDAELVWMLNNDTIVAPDSLTQLVSCVQRDPSIAAVGATLLEFDRPDIVQYLAGASISPWRGRIRLFGRGQPATAPRPQPAPLHYVSGASLLVPVRVLHDVGLLDERFFMYSEDADWCFRMRDAGYRVSYAPQAEVWHKGGASWTPGNPAQDYHNLAGNLLMMRKHYPLHTPIAVLWAVGRFLVPRIVRGEWRRAGAILGAFRDFAIGDAGSSRSGSGSPTERTALAEPIVSADAP